MGMASEEWFGIDPHFKTSLVSGLNSPSTQRFLWLLNLILTRKPFNVMNTTAAPPSLAYRFSSRSKRRGVTLTGKLEFD